MSARILRLPVSTDTRKPSSSSSSTLPTRAPITRPRTTYAEPCTCSSPLKPLPRLHLPIGHKVQGTGDPISGPHAGNPSGRGGSGDRVAARDQGDLVLRDGHDLVPGQADPPPPEQHSHDEQHHVSRDRHHGEQRVVDLAGGTICRRLARDHPHEEHVRLLGLSEGGRIYPGRVAPPGRVDRPRQAVLDQVVPVDRPRLHQGGFDVLARAADFSINERLVGEREVHEEHRRQDHQDARHRRRLVVVRLDHLCSATSTQAASVARLVSWRIRSASTSAAAGSRPHRWT